MTKVQTLAAIATSVLFVAPGSAHACSQQEAMAKGVQLSQMLQTKMAQDPGGTQALMAKMQPVMMASQTQMASGGVVDWDKVCGTYDQLMKQAQ